MQYRGEILPLVRLDRHLGAYGETDREVLEVVVYTDRGRSVALVVEQILDIVDGEAAVRSDIDDGPARLRRHPARSPSCSTSGPRSSPPTRRSSPPRRPPRDAAGVPDAFLEV